LIASGALQEREQRGSTRFFLFIEFIYFCLGAWNKKGKGERGKRKEEGGGNIGKRYAPPKPQKKKKIENAILNRIFLFNAWRA
jgi:hypothetical protein